MFDDYYRLMAKVESMDTDGEYSILIKDSISHYVVYKVLINKAIYNNLLKVADLSSLDVSPLTGDEAVKIDFSKFDKYIQQQLLSALPEMNEFEFYIQKVSHI